MNGQVTQNRREKWTAPARPAWVQQVNQEGLYLDAQGIVPLDSASLIAKAIENTGLSNFGSDEWREPFDVICRGLDSEAKLTLMGRIMTRSDMLMMLEGRLRVEEAYRLHPEIEDEAITAPLMIVGQGRSGTSALFNLLSYDPNTVVPRTWQAMMPDLPHEGPGPDPRIQIIEDRVTMWNRVTPELVAMHEFNAMVPTETIQLEALSFQQPSWQTLYGQNPSHYVLMATRSMVPPVAYGKRVLKLLQFRQPKRQWVLKSPDLLNYLPDALEVYPDMGLVWIHRDPIVSLSSMISLVGVLSFARSDQVLPEGTFDQVASPSGAAKMLSDPIDWIRSGILHADRVHSAYYEDFVADPIKLAAGIYRHFGIELTDSGRAAMQKYVDEHPRSSRPAHRYELGQGEAARAEREVFRRYQEYFNVQSEG